jgi:hypothetical protein
MQALPSGWDGLHLTEKWAQETGNGTCLIYMESCSEVTRKNEMNKCKRQSAFLRPSRHFSFNDFKFEYSRPLVLAKNAARSQQKKGIVRWGSAHSGPNKLQELSTSELFSQLPTALCLGGWDISISFCNKFSWSAENKRSVFFLTLVD